MKITLKQAMDAIKAAGCTIETKLPASEWHDASVSDLIFVAYVPITKLNESEEYNV